MEAASLHARSKLACLEHTGLHVPLVGLIVRWEKANAFIARYDQAWLPRSSSELDAGICCLVAIKIDDGACTSHQALMFGPERLVEVLIERSKFGTARH